MRFHVVAVHIPQPKQRAIESRAGGDMDRCTIAGCAGAARCNEQFVGTRIVDRADPALSFFEPGDRDAPVVHAMDEVERAVDRIDNPGPFGHIAARFLAEHRVIGIGARQFPADERFDGAVGRADIVLPRLGLDDEFQFMPEVAVGERTGRACQAAGEFGACGEAVMTLRHGQPVVGGITTTPWCASAMPTPVPTASGSSTAVEITNNSPIGDSSVYSIKPPR